MPPAHVVRVVPDVPAIHRRFDYSVPAALVPEIRVGSRVRVDLHGRRVGAWVVEDRVEAPPGVTLKPLAGVERGGTAPGGGGPGRVGGLALGRPDVVLPRHGLATPGGPAAGRRGRRPTAPVVPPSPGGGSVPIVDDALAVAGTAVVRLAPALDATLVVLELIHRLGSRGLLVLAPSRARVAQLADRLSRSGVPVAPVPDQWEQASSGTGVVVGARAGPGPRSSHCEAWWCSTPMTRPTGRNGRQPGRRWTSSPSGPGAMVPRSCSSRRARRCP